MFPLSVNDWIDLRHRLSGGLSYAKPGETNLSWKPRKTGTARRCNLNIERVHNSNLTGINHETHEVWPPSLTFINTSMTYWAPISARRGGQ